MKQTILGLVLVFLLVPSIISANQPTDLSTIDVSQYTTKESLEELQIVLLKQVIVLLELRVEQLLAIGGLSDPRPKVLGAATSTATEESRPRSRSGGGGGSSGGSSENDVSTETDGDTASTTDDGTGTSTDDGTDAATSTENTASSSVLHLFELNEVESVLDSGVSYQPVADISLQFMNGTATLDTLLLRFAESPDGVDLWQVFESVSLWVLGDRVAEIPANTPDAYGASSTLRFVDLDLTFEEDEEHYIVVAASLASSTYAAQFGKYLLEVPEVSFVDNYSATTTLTDFGDIGPGHGVVFSVTELGGETLEFSVSSNDPDATVLVVDEDDTTEHTIFTFRVTPEGGELYTETIGIAITTPGGMIDEIIDDAQITVDGEQYRVELTTPLGTDGDSAVYIFEVDQVFEETTAYDIELMVEFEDQADNYPVPQTIFAAVTEEAQAYWDVEGYDDLNPATDFVGTVSGDTHTLRTGGLMLDIVSTDTTHFEELGYGEFVIEFDVTAVEDDYFFTDNAGLAGVADGIVYSIDGGTVADTVATVSSTADESISGVFEVREGETETVELAVQVTPDETGIYRVALADILVTTTADGVSGVESTTITDLADFRTDYLQIDVLDK